jgi:hypothetical protein
MKLHLEVPILAVLAQLHLHLLISWVNRRNLQDLLEGVYWMLDEEVVEWRIIGMMI